MPPRILPIERPDPQTADALAKTPSPHGRPLNIFTTLAHHRVLLERTNALGGVFMRFSTIPARERELVILRTAWRSDCAYAYGQHAATARRCGLSEEELERVVRPDLSGWSETDRVLLMLVDDLLDQCHTDVRTWRSLEEQWTEPQCLELLLMVGFYRMLAGYLNSVDVELDEDVRSRPE